MRDKIIHLMKIEGLTTTRLAQMLGVQPSAISHLVSGRNKPRFDILQKILRRFPHVNPDWLLLDSDVPFRSEERISGGDDERLEGSSEATTEDQIPFDVASDDSAMQREHFSSDSPQPLINLAQSMNRGSKSPIFVVLFYDDGSCESFSMRK